VLVCLHDDSLERTTNVEQVFPERFTLDVTGQKRWMIADFTLAEVKQLDAGSWFDRKFADEKVLTWDEAVAIVRGRAGLYPELKSPSRYQARGLDLPRLFVEALRRTGLHLPDSGPRPLVVQSFDPAALRALAAELPRLPRVLLIDGQMANAWLSDEGLQRVRRFAIGIGPAKGILLARPDVAARARQAGLTVTPYTFRSGNTGDFADVAAEMRHFIVRLRVDAVFTDNPDRFPRQ
jgi:glycerophosphoryl diester phosphodiesterase